MRDTTEVGAMANDDAKTRILNAAGPVFAEKGYKGASVREICDAAGVNQAAINYYFGGKELLYRETFRSAHPVDGEPVEALSYAPGTEPAEKLRTFIHRVMQSLMGVQRDSWQGRLLAREMLDPSPTCLEELRQRILNRFHLLRDILTELLPKETPEDRIIKMGLSVMGQCVHYRFGEKVIELIVDPSLRAAHFTTEQIADHIADVCLAAVGRAPSLHERFSDGQTQSISDPSRADCPETVSGPADPNDGIRNAS